MIQGLHSEVPAGLPLSLRELTAPCYVHRAAQWKVTALSGLALLLVLTGLSVGLWNLDLDRAGAPEAAFAAFLLLFLVVLLRPSSWRAPVVAAADRRGIFFVGGRESVLVPWSEVGPLTIEKARLAQGVGESVVVAVSSASSLWDAAKRSKFRDWLMGSEKPPGFHRVPLGTQGIDPRITLACLEELRGEAGPANG